LDSLVIARAVHIASTAIVAGAIFFQSFVLAPAFRSYAHPAAASVSQRVKTLVWIALPVAVLSALAWLLLLAARIADQGVIEAAADGVAYSVLINTRFGHDWIVRLGIALFLAAILFRRPGELRATWQDRVSPLVAAALLGSIAWSGHAGASPGVVGAAHLVSDFVHLVAVGAWIGALPPLAILLSFSLQPANHALKDAVTLAAHHFSTLAMLSVAALAVTGIINTSNLAGTVPALVETEYGRLLLLKILLFIAILGPAAVNRLRLLPRLPATDAIRRLRRNVLLEIGLATAIVLIVGALGTMPPGEHIQSEPHIH
jgi:putative copper resistance protein D